MRIGDETISALAKIITGDPTRQDETLAPYRSGPDLVDFFNQFGGNDTYTYGGGFPSRWCYAEEKIRQANGTETLAKIVVASLDPRHFIDAKQTVENAANYLNQYLRFDKYEVFRAGHVYKIRSLAGTTVELQLHERKLTHEFIEEQISKCDRKIPEGDYDGAITNARSLVEAVLVELEREISGTSEPYGGDLGKLFKRLQKKLNLDPSRKDVSDSLRQVLSGLISIVSGLAPMRNVMGDAHAVEYRPAKHHAKLAVNAAKTVADFLFSTYEYQRSRGAVSSIEEKEC